MGLAALALFALTASRGAEWQDAGVHQYRILVGQLESPLGLALSHPLHYWLGRAALHLPLGNPLYRLNLLSAVCGAIGIGVLVRLVLSLTGNRAAAAFAGITLALAHPYWQMSATTETYTLAAALMLIEWLLLWQYARRRQAVWLVAVFLVNGLHVADHPLGLLPLAAYGGLLIVHLAGRRLRLRWLPACAAAWMVGAAPYLALAAGHWARTGSLAETISSALFGGTPTARSYSSFVLNCRISGSQLMLAALTLGYAFPSLALVVAGRGIIRPMRGRRRMWRTVLLVQTVLIVGFVVRYPIPDLYTYFVPVCVLVALWFGRGVDAMWRRRPARPDRWLVGGLIVSAVFPLAVYEWFPVLARDRGWLRNQMRTIPFRDEYASFFRPWRCGDDSATVFAEAALRELGTGGWFLADSTTAPPVALECLLRGAAPGIRVYWTRECLFPVRGPVLDDDALEAHLAQGGVVLAAPSFQVHVVLGDRFAIEETTPFWRIRLRSP